MAHISTENCIECNLGWKLTWSLVTKKPAATSNNRRVACRDYDYSPNVQRMFRFDVRESHSLPFELWLSIFCMLVVQHEIDRLRNQHDSKWMRWKCNIKMCNNHKECKQSAIHICCDDLLRMGWRLLLTCAAIWCVRTSIWLYAIHWNPTPIHIYFHSLCRHSIAPNNCPFVLQ